MCATMLDRGRERSVHGQVVVLEESTHAHSQNSVMVHNFFDEGITPTD
jgi:hypothetical protein